LQTWESVNLGALDNSKFILGKLYMVEKAKNKLTSPYSNEAVICVASMRQKLHWYKDISCIQDAWFSCLQHYFKKKKIKPIFYNVSWDESIRPKRDIESLKMANIIIIMSSNEFTFHNTGLVNPLHAQTMEIAIDKAKPHLRNKHILIISCDKMDTIALYKKYILKNARPKTINLISECDLPMTVQTIRYFDLANIKKSKIKKYDFVYWGAPKKKLPGGKQSGDARYDIIRRTLKDSEIKGFLAGNHFGSSKADIKFNTDLSQIAGELTKGRATTCFQWPGHGDCLTARYHEALAFGIVPLVHKDYDIKGVLCKNSWQRFDGIDDLKEKLLELRKKAFFSDIFNSILKSYLKNIPSKNKQLSNASNLLNKYL